MTQASRRGAKAADAPKPYVPKRRGAKPRIDRERQKLVSAYLSTPERPTLWDELMEYLDHHDISQTEWMRWMAAKCVDERLVPPKE